MNPGSKAAFDFVVAVICHNPMESEIFSASLREQGVPHRTEGSAQERLTLMVPREWLARAREVLSRASLVFFKEELPVLEDASQPAKEAHGSEQSRPSGQLGELGPQVQDEDEEDDDDDEEEDEPGALFRARSVLFKPVSALGSQGTSIRPVWPAWVLASIPGLGLGHLYAGKIRFFLHLMLLTCASVAFWIYSRSSYSLIFIGLSWITDLSFAARHVREHNKRVEKYLTAIREEEGRFLDEMKSIEEHQDDKRQNG